MEHLVRFRLLANELNDNEFCHFLSQFVSLKGRDLLLQLFFMHFLKTTNDDSLQSVILLLSHIITNREESLSASTLSPNLNALPSALISETASYLKATEYILFSRCSRKLYVSCNSPCKIVAIPTMLIKKYPLNASMNKFKSLKQLGLNIKYFNKISISNQSTWHNVRLHTLQLSNRSGSESDCLQFIERSKLWNTQNLKLHKFGKDIHNKFDSKCFISLLENFEMIENLLLWDVFLRDDNVEYIEDDVKKWLPNLKGFGFTSGSNQRLSHCIISALSHQLEALRIEGLSLNYHNISAKSFPKLKELSLSMCNLDILSMFINVSTLASVMISSSKEEIIEEFIKIMISKPLMKHIHIKSPAKLLQFAMQETEKMLFTTKDIKRFASSLQIIFDANNWDHYSVYTFGDELQLTMFRLINALEKSQINDFILRIKTTAKQKEININETTANIKNWLSVWSKQNYLVHHQFSTKKLIDTFIFTISNKNCKVNGFRYCWKMWSSSL